MKVITTVQIVLVLMACTEPILTCGLLYRNDTDQLSLLDFKKAISFDPQQTFMSWNGSVHFCNWEGIRCRVKIPRRVTSLDLTNRGLVGQISPSLGNLTFLKFLFLDTNSFTGEIPPSLGQLRHLQAISLSNNTLQGSIPSLANCSSLKELWLNGNNLVGKIPADLHQGFTTLEISINNLTGATPASLANVTTLRSLHCQYNNIVGNIPKEFGKMPGMLSVQLGANKLEGWFPEAFLNLSTLTELSLASNYLSGVLPFNIGNSVPNLQVLRLGGNLFHGNIPCSLTNASKLYLLDMSINSFTGVVPSSVGKLTKLSWLNLEINKLHAYNEQDLEFMSSVANCTELQMFSIYGNRLKGHVPNSFGNRSTQLQYIHMGSNQLSGSLPSGLANLPNLIALELGGNLFTDVLPGWLGSLKSLQVLALYNNLFLGSIPASLSNLSQMVHLELSTNKLDGYIPPSLGDLQMLEVLLVSHNNLQGRVPNNIFRIPTISVLWLSFNQLDGELPTEVGNAKQLMVMHLSYNNLSGDIPLTLGSCKSLEDIKLDRNVFSGNIPITLGSISTLKALDLSHNNLSGTVPVSLANLELLQQLDLSFNNLKGEVPTKGIFKNATAIHIVGNQQLCGGVPQLHLPTCSVMPLNLTKHKHSIELKVVLPAVASMMVSLAVVVFFLIIWRGKQRRKSVASPSFDSSFPTVSYNVLARATDGFSESKLIGRGRHSSVYQGKLFASEAAVAIKVFSLQIKGAQNSFIAECNVLRNVRHRNLVPILTACSSIDGNRSDFKALVYEFMPRGDLHLFLYSTCEDGNTSNHITLAQRLSILVDVADALEYLHHYSQGTIVHCDVKPSNILLDEEMIAHVGDFGLARLMVDSSTSTFTDSASSVAFWGTIGYVAPEYATGGGGQVSTAADVYSFGVVLLEVFLRKRPTHNMFQDGLNIAKYVEMNFPDRIMDIIDPELLRDLRSQEAPMVMEENCLGSLVSVLNIGLCCVKTSPNERVDMQEVAARLHGIKDAYLCEHR